MWKARQGKYDTVRKNICCYDLIFLTPLSKERWKAKHFTLEWFHVSLLSYWWDFGLWFCCHIGGPIEFVQSLPGILVNSGSNCVTTTWKRWMAKCDCKLFNLILWSQWFNTFKCNRSMFDLKQELGSNQGKTYMPRDSDSFLLDRSMNFKLWLKLEEKYSVNLLEIERSIDILVHTSNMCS